MGSKGSESNVVLREVSETDSISSFESHIFQEPKVAEFYRNLYEERKYEGRHLFDPDFYWSKAEEKKVLKKTEFRVAVWAFVMFMALNFDRYNIRQAIAGNMLQDVGLSEADYNIGNTINLVCFLAAELPSQLISKKVGPDIWIPIQMVSWSIVAITQCKITNKAGFYITRALVGALEGGFIPDIFTWLSYFYTSKEIPNRLAIFYSANPLSIILTSLVAYGIFHIDGHGGMEGWRWLFLIEGLATLLVGITAFFLMPASAVQTKAMWRPKGWYTEREEKIMVNRILRDDPMKGDMHNREAVSFKGLLWALLDYNHWPVYLMRFFGDIGHAPTSIYMTVSLRKLGFDQFQTNLLLIPSSFVNLIQLFVVSWIANKTRSHFWAYLYQPIWHIPTLLALRFWPGTQINAWGTYALLTVVQSAPAETHISTSWCSLNSNSVRARTVSAAVVNMFSQTAGIVASNIYQENDAPIYHKGNDALIGIAFCSLATVIFGRLMFLWRNKRRDKVWDSMSQDEKLNYIENTKDTGNQRLDFRFHY